MFWKKYDVLNNKISNLVHQFYGGQQRIYNLESKVEKLEKKLKKYDDIFGIEASVCSGGAFTTIVNNYEHEFEVSMFGPCYLASTKLNNLMHFLGIEEYQKKEESCFRKIEK